MAIQKIGVIGAGQMGNGIAHVCAVAGFDVGLNDLSVEQIESGLATINGNLERQVSKRQAASEEKERSAGLAGLCRSENLEGSFHGYDLVIESGHSEIEDVKRKIFSDLCPLLDERTIIGNQHLVNLDHPAGGIDRPAGAVHGHSFHEPGAGDGNWSN